MNDFHSLKSSSISLYIFSIRKKFQTLCCLALCLMIFLVWPISGPDSIRHYGAGGVKKRAKDTVARSMECRSGTVQDVRTKILLMIEDLKKTFFDFFVSLKNVIFGRKIQNKRDRYVVFWATGLSEGSKIAKIYLNWVNKKLRKKCLQNFFRLFKNVFLNQKIKKRDHDLVA